MGIVKKGLRGMLDSVQPSNLTYKTLILSPVVSIWPCCGWAALLHISVIGGSIWQQSTPPLPVMKEGRVIEMIEVDLTPTSAPALLPSKPQEEKIIKSKSSVSLFKTPQKKLSLNESEAIKEVKAYSVKPALSLYIGNPHPPYPETARENMIEGKVTVVLKVEATTGMVQTIQVISKDSPECLVESVVKTVKKWRFHPLNVPGMIEEIFPFEFLLN